MSFLCTSALNAISNEPALIHFASGKFCSHENLMPVRNFILVIFVKMIDIKSITVWLSFLPIHVNTSKELIEHRSEVFNAGDSPTQVFFYESAKFLRAPVWQKNLQKTASKIMIIFLPLVFSRFYISLDKSFKLELK